MSVAAGTVEAQASDEPSAVATGIISALSVVLAVGVLVAGLLTIASINFWLGLVVALGAIPLWGWACVQNRAYFGH